MTDQPDQHPPCGQTRAHDWMTFTCTRPAGHDGGHTDRSYRALWLGDSPATDLEGRPFLKGMVQRPAFDPRAFRRRRPLPGRDT